MENSKSSHHEITINRSMQQFLFPLLLKEDKIKFFSKDLIHHGFQFFDLGNEDQEDLFYGEDTISHRALDHYFMPNIEPILFPDSPSQREGIRRYSKKINRKYTLKAPFLETVFTLESVDIFICPFHIGFINLRITLPGNLRFDDVIYFGDTFRIMEPISEAEPIKIIDSEGVSYHKVKDYIFAELIPPIESFVDNRSRYGTSYFGSLPFFIDERMFVISYFQYNGAGLPNEQLYRIGKLNGYNSNGEAFINAFNPDYIKAYYKNNVYSRWSDRTYYVMSENHFSCITREDGRMEKDLASKMYGEHFYSTFLLLYYKSVLMKLTHDHAEVEVMKGKDQTNSELLIIMITEFSSKYYLPSIISSESGTEIFEKMKGIFRIEKLYEEVKDTLTNLYLNQEKIMNKRMNYLLQILTMYMVISGIFGMNLVIEDWKGSVQLSDLTGYSIFEWFSLVVILSGIFVAITLGIFFLKSYLKELRSKKKKLF